VPGALHAWQELLDKLGTQSLGKLLQPAIQAARDGFEVTPIIGRDWAAQQTELENGTNTHVYLPDGKAPKIGERFCQPELARSLELIADQGISAFYNGALSEAIVNQSQSMGGWLMLEDFSSHASEWVTPISANYRGYDVYQLPPNGQGVITLEALNILEGFDLAGMDEVARYHTQTEALKLAFADAWQYVADPEFSNVPVESLISKAYADERRGLISDKALQDPQHGFPNSGTIYVTVVDQDGNCCSLTNSIYMHFGSKVVAGGTGIVLQNRAALSSLDPEHPNALEGEKRPYHTIIPPIVMKQGKPWLCFGVVGGFMQPQAHVQILNNLIDFDMSVADAVNAPRSRWLNKAQITLEEGISDDVRQGLADRGHQVMPPGGFGGFGGAQAILIDGESGKLQGASDLRKDGIVQGI
jgi:gamma-glutamyltranspeptidase/glutathione hydrolase